MTVRIFFFSSAFLLAAMGCEAVRFRHNDTVDSAATEDMLGGAPVSAIETWRELTGVEFQYAAALTSNSSLSAMGCGSNVLECFLHYFEKFLIIIERSVDVSQDKVVSSLMSRGDWLVSPTTVCISLGNHCQRVSDLTLKIMAMAWNVVVLYFCYTQSWEVYFALFPSGWKKMYDMLLKDPKYFPFYLLSFRYAQFGSKYVQQLNTGLHNFVDAQIPVGKAIELVEHSVSAATKATGGLPPSLELTGLQSLPAFSSASQAAIDLVAANAQQIKDNVARIVTAKAIAGMVSKSALQDLSLVNASAALAQNPEAVGLVREGIALCRWRQTKTCDPNGARKPSQDKECSEVIPVGSPGFCDCDGSGSFDKTRDTAFCDVSPGRCKDVCQADEMRHYNSKLSELNREYAQFNAKLQEKLAELEETIRDDMGKRGKKFKTRHLTRMVAGNIAEQNLACLHNSPCINRTMPLASGRHKKACFCEPSYLGNDGCGQGWFGNPPWCKVNPAESYCGKRQSEGVLHDGDYHWAYCGRDTATSKYACDTGNGWRACTP